MGTKRQRHWRRAAHLPAGWRRAAKTQPLPAGASEHRLRPADLLLVVTILSAFAIVALLAWPH